MTENNENEEGSDRKEEVEEKEQVKEDTEVIRKKLKQNSHLSALDVISAAFHVDLSLLLFGI